MSTNTTSPRSGPIVFLDNREIRRRLNIGKTNHQGKVNEGLIPEPVSIGKRKKATPEHEVNEVAAAYLSGAPEAEIKELVARLHAARGQRHGAGSGVTQDLQALHQGRQRYWANRKAAGKTATDASSSGGAA